jgi:hypothetical protein
VGVARVYPSDGFLHLRAVDAVKGEKDGQRREVKRRVVLHVICPLIMRDKSVQENGDGHITIPR